MQSSVPLPLTPKVLYSTAQGRERRERTLGSRRTSVPTPQGLHKTCLVQPLRGS